MTPSHITARDGAGPHPLDSGGAGWDAVELYDLTGLTWSFTSPSSTEGRNIVKAACKRGGMALKGYSDWRKEDWAKMAAKAGVKFLDTFSTVAGMRGFRVCWAQHGVALMYVPGIRRFYTLADIAAGVADEKAERDAPEVVKVMENVGRVKKEFAEQFAIASDPALAGGFEDAPIVVVADFGLARDEEEAPSSATPERPSEADPASRPEEGDGSPPPPGEPDWTGETGTYLYMAPEVVRHESYDASCDVWSFGVMLGELIAGAPPYRSQRREAAMTASQIAVGVADGAVAFEIAADAPPGLAAIVRKCVERDARDRPSFAEICDALDAMLPAVLRDLEEKEKEARRNSLKGQLGAAFRNVAAFVEETAATVRESLDIRDPDAEGPEMEASTVSLDAFLAKPGDGEAGASAEGGEARSASDETSR